MLATITNTKEFMEYLEECSEITCLLFVAEGSNQSRALEPILLEECEKAFIPLIKIFVNNPAFFDLINKYNVGLLPRYIFVKENKTLYSSHGFTSRQIIKESIRKIGGNEWLSKTVL